jgi:hypothetical protein
MVALPGGTTVRADSLPEASEVTAPEPWGERIFRDRARLEVELRAGMRRIAWPVKLRRYVPMPNDSLERVLANAVALLLDERAGFARYRSLVRGLLRRTLRGQYQPFKPGPTPLSRGKRGAVREIYEAVLHQWQYLRADSDATVMAEALLNVLREQSLSPVEGWQIFESNVRSAVGEAYSPRGRLTGKQLAQKITAAFYKKSESWVRDQVKHASYR